MQHKLSQRVHLRAFEAARPRGLSTATTQVYCGRGTYSLSFSMLLNVNEIHCRVSLQRVFKCVSKAKKSLRILNTSLTFLVPQMIQSDRRKVKMQHVTWLLLMSLYVFCIYGEGDFYLIPNKSTCCKDLTPSFRFHVLNLFEMNFTF